MERREFLALLGTPVYAELARRIGLRTASEEPDRGAHKSIEEVVEAALAAVEQRTMPGFA